MLEPPIKATQPDVYERLIDRLGLALDVARTAVRLRDEKPAELELRGLSRAEYELIDAYLHACGERACVEPQAPAPAPVAPALKPSAKVYWLHEHDRRRSPIGKHGHGYSGKS
ncbi:hypothetical protein IFT75_11315 [Pseudomonas sp. CFBP 8758]|uniref:hypothetical protein n=1 Tax=Pseudomonas sp. CFBP 8758 TaxID=2775286 RepID=UPI0017817EB0|nr:hypothetical protein [Pseudomonas sp. CFBP 8758]MBD8593994.1 hypothetical protein [Pseudomonas sp. CFBP 8758]